MAQIQKKFIANNAVDENKIRLSNTGQLKARNAADSGDVNILQVNASDRILFASVPQVGADAVSGNDLVRLSQLQGMYGAAKAAVAAASPSNIDLSVAADPSPIDGHTIADGDRVLLYSQTAPAENGIYVAVTAVDPTTWTRALDMDSAAEFDNAYTAVEFGTLNLGKVFIVSVPPVVLGTDPVTFVTTPAATAYTGGDMITLSGNAFSVDLAAISGLESTNPGNAAGQLRNKLEASNPSLQIDGSNQLGVKIDVARSLSSGASGLGINLAAVSGLQHSSNQLSIKLEASNPTLQIDGSNQLGVKLDAAGAIVTGASGIKAQTDASTVKINGSNQLEALQPVEERITLSGTDITNQYVDLAQPIFGSSASANSATLFAVGGPMQLKTVDYTVSLTGGSGGVTRISFAGDLATGGPAALIAGDILVIDYEYLA